MRQMYRILKMRYPTYQANYLSNIRRLHLHQARSTKTLCKCDQIHQVVNIKPCCYSTCKGHGLLFTQDCFTSLQHPEQLSSTKYKVCNKMIVLTASCNAVNSACKRKNMNTPGTQTTHPKNKQIPAVYTGVPISKKEISIVKESNDDDARSIYISSLNGAYVTPQMKISSS